MVVLVFGTRCNGSSSSVGTDSTTDGGVSQVSDQRTSSSLLYWHSKHSVRRVQPSPARSRAQIINSSSPAARVLLDTFPALSLGDLRTGSVLLYLLSTATTNLTHTALRAVVHSRTCVTYYSTDKAVYCVHSHLNTTKLHQFSFGHIDNFVVVSQDSQDYLRVRRS